MEQIGADGMQPDLEQRGADRGDHTGQEQRTERVGPAPRRSCRPEKWRIHRPRRAGDRAHRGLPSRGWRAQGHDQHRPQRHPVRGGGGGFEITGKGMECQRRMVSVMLETKIPHSETQSAKRGLGYL